MIRKFSISSAILVSLLGFGLGGCPAPNVGGETSDPKLIRFESQDALVKYFREQVAARNAAQRGGFFGFFEDTATLDSAAPEAGSTDDGASFTTTNLQEAGVDESDVFKSDGERFYLARGGSLRIIQAAPVEQMAEIGRLDFDDIRIDSMYLRGDKLLVLGHARGGGYYENVDILIYPPYFVGNELVVYEVDISDPTKPTATRVTRLDGSLVSSRLIEDSLVLVMTVAPDLPDEPITLEQILPDVKRGAAGCPEDVVTWDAVFRPANPDGYYLTAVVTLNADDIEQQKSAVAIMGNAQTVYASTEAVYVSDAQYTPTGNQRERTAVHKLSLDKAGAAQYVASGSVPGRLLNQFSLDEHEGNLRLATHVQNFNVRLFGDDVVAIGIGVGGVDEAAPADAATRAQSVATDQPFNAVYVLEEAGASLNVVGAIENIAPGERIYSARFLGDRGFLVTFRQIDPLFAMDLSDPKAPQIVGELKIPGFSDYLHPVDDDRLLGIGRGTAENDFGGVTTRGVQLSLFDVSDLANPQVIEQLEIGGFGSTSEVSYTHKAFAMLPNENVFVLPVRLTTNTGMFDYQPDFQGVLTYAINKDGLEELGRVPVAGGGQSFYFGYFGWQRPAIIGGTVYAVSTEGVAAANRETFSPVTSIELEGSDEGFVETVDDGERKLDDE